MSDSPEIARFKAMLVSQAGEDLRQTIMSLAKSKGISFAEAWRTADPSVFKEAQGVEASLGEQASAPIYRYDPDKPLKSVAKSLRSIVRESGLVRVEA